VIPDILLNQACSYTKEAVSLAMNLPDIAVVKETERAQVMSSMMLGFSADPLVRWFYPEADDYVNSIPVFDAFGGGAIDTDTAYRTANLEGAALWHPPGRGPDEARLIDYLENTLRAEVKDDVFRCFEAMGEYHPEGECWYLPLIAVDPAHQGMGIGAALLKHVLRIIDEQGLPAYLESSNPRNISLYERHGFETVGEIQFGDSPVVTPMMRAARA
jgi:GNAT superfamily N-acetyltransferase